MNSYSMLVDGGSLNEVAEVVGTLSSMDAVHHGVQLQLVIARFKVHYETSSGVISCNGVIAEFSRPVRHKLP